MWPDGERSLEDGPARGSESSDVEIFTGQMVAAATRQAPGAQPINANVTRSRQVYVGTNFLTINQPVLNNDVVKGNFLCLEMVSPEQSRRLRCSVAVFVCWALIVAGGLAAFLFFAMYNRQTRLDLIELSLPRYVWSVLKNTTRAERISCAVALGLVILCNILIVIYFTVITKPHEDDKAPHEWNISRAMWLAKSYNNTDLLSPHFQPVRLVIINHSVSGECHNFLSCSSAVLNLQGKTYDLPYNFVIGNDGRVYEGRGWGKEGAYTTGYNRCAVGLGFIGDYRRTHVTKAQVKSTEMLLADGVLRGFLARDYYIVGHRDLKPSESPGTYLYNAMRKWQRYDNENRFIKKNCTQITAMQLDEPKTWNITRGMWGGRLYGSEIPAAYQPTRLVTIRDWASAQCNTFDKCARQLRQLQVSEDNMNYNFVVGNDGRVYEGLGWGVESASDIGRCSVVIVFTGDLRNSSTNSTDIDAQLKVTDMLLEAGIHSGHLHKDYYVTSDKDFKLSESPVPYFHTQLQKWKHYVEAQQFGNKTCGELYAKAAD